MMVETELYRTSNNVNKKVSCSGQSHLKTSGQHWTSQFVKIWANCTKLAHVPPASAQFIIPQKHNSCWGQIKSNKALDIVKSNHLA